MSEQYIAIAKSPVHGHYSAVLHDGMVCLEGGKDACIKAALSMTCHDQLVNALGPYSSGGEWGKWLAWLVEGAPTREQGIAAAKIIVSCQVAADAILSQAQQP